MEMKKVSAIYLCLSIFFIFLWHWRPAKNQAQAEANGGGSLLNIAVADLTFNEKEKATTIEKNPLKGLMPPEWLANTPDRVNEMPFSMEYFYISLKDVMVGSNDFNWSE